MASPYASATPGGGSPYATGTASSGSAYAGGGSAAPAKKSNGGLLGSIEHVGHVVAGKAALAGHDLLAAPGGIANMVKVAGLDVGSRAGNVVGLVSKTTMLRNAKAANDLGAQIVKSTEQTVEHPLRDPFATATILLPFLRGAGSAALRSAAVADAAKEGTLADVVKAAATKPEIKPRLIKMGDSETPLQPSMNPGVRVVQHAYDHLIQSALDTNPEGKLAAHAASRIGGSLAESGRVATRMKDAPANMIAAQGHSLGPAKFSPRRIVSKAVPRKIQEAALRLTSENDTPENAATFHRAQAAKGVSPKANLRQAKLYDVVARHGLVTTDEHGNAIIDATTHPKLAALDSLIAQGQDQVDKIAKDHDLMTEEQLQARKNGPSRIRAGATYENPTPGKEGVPSQALVKQRAYVARLATLHERATAKAAEKATAYPNVHTRTGFVKQELAFAPEAALKRQHIEVAPGPRTPGAPSDLPAKGLTNPITERLGGALSVARDRLQQMEQAAASRVKPTGIIGGETARPGRGFVTYRTEEPRAAKNAVASASSPVVGKAKSFIPKKSFTGSGLENAKVPDNTSRLVAQHMRDAYRYSNTTQFRDTVAKTGSDTRRSSRDVLVRQQSAEPVGKPSAEIDELLGRKHSTLGELDAVQHGFEEWRKQIVPSLGSSKAATAEKATGIGTEAPEGYKWVDKNVLGDLGKAAPGPRGRIARTSDKINTAVTAATVYFKVGHLGTREATNAVTNMIQGSADPKEIGKSVELWKQLTPVEKAKALAAAGQHGFNALPLHDETGRVSKAISGAASAGAHWWAKHADSPFRFNSLAFEARKAGFTTPTQFRDLLDKLENPHDHNMNAAEAAKVDWVAKRANRESIAYDRLSNFERTYLTRAFWFYPWLAGSTRFAVNTALEHPYKSALIGGAGMQGRKDQLRLLGPLASYEGGLYKVAGGALSPLVADLSTFSPFATPGQLLEGPSYGKVADYLNPVYGAAFQLAARENQYGEHSNSPLVSAASTLFSPTPEAQILSAWLNPKSGGMFHTTPMSALVRSLLGPATPRRLNTAAASKDAGLERSGR